MVRLTHCFMWDINECTPLLLLPTVTLPTIVFSVAITLLGHYELFLVSVHVARVHTRNMRSNCCTKIIKNTNEMNTNFRISCFLPRVRVQGRSSKFESLNMRIV